MAHRLGQYLVAGVVAAAATRSTHALTQRWNPRSWQRPSFSGATVQLTGGLDAALGSTVGLIAGAIVGGGVHTPAALIAGGMGATAGAIDDHLETRFPAKGKGFHGHLGALRQGKISSGLIKIGVIGAGSLVSAAMLPPQSARLSASVRIVDAGVNSLLIAGTANLINLLDLRPGRALKVVAAVSQIGVPVAAPAASGALLGTSVAAAPSDLRGETMLGDLGANALGAQLGVALASVPSRFVRVGALGAVVGLTALSEKISFSKVIAENRILNTIDQWGRS